jgi:putative oxidoreductase
VLAQLNKHQEFCPMLSFDLLTRYRNVRWAPLPLRLIVGVGFMEHGFAKLSKGPDAFAAILHAIGIRALL